MKIAVLDDYQKVAPGLADWSSLTGATVTFFSDHLDDPAGLVSRLADFDAVVVMRERTAFPAALLARLPRLRLLVTPGMRNAVIDLAGASRLGITVSGVDGGSVATAELAWGLVLCLLRHIPAEDAALRAGGWQSTVGTGLAGKTLGLLVLSARTRGLVGQAELALMKPGAYLVNTSRAGIVERGALLAALRSGHLAGAGLDVFDEEPLPPGDPLLVTPRTVLTPHLGFVTREVYAGWYCGAVEDIVAFRTGRPIRVLNEPGHA